MINITEFNEFISSSSERLLESTGKPITEYETTLCRIVWDIAEVAAFAHAAKIAYRLHELGYDAADAPSELNAVAGVTNA